MSKRTGYKTSVIIIMSLAILFTSISLLVTTVPGQVKAQNSTVSNSTTKPENASLNLRVNDFKALKDEYLAKWKELGFRSVFDTFVVDRSVQGYGVYEPFPSNIFSPDTRAIVLYIEPVGFGYKQGVDKEGKPLYAFDFKATIAIKDSHGTPLTDPIPIDYGTPLNSHNRVTEAYMPLSLILDKPLPIGDYTLEYKITDNSTGNSFTVIKDIRVAQPVS